MLASVELAIFVALSRGSTDISRTRSPFSPLDVFQVLRDKISTQLARTLDVFLSWSGSWTAKYVVAARR